jgi:cell division septation protein DedD
MDSQLKQRLIGASVLVALAVIFLPMLLKGPDVKEPDAAQVPLSMPATPGQEYETRELPLTMPEGSAPKGGVLGMTPAEPAPLPAPEAAAPAPAASVAVAAPAIAASVAAAAPAKVTPPAPAPAPMPAMPPPAEPAAVAAGKYMINIGSFSNLANANALVEKLRAQKLPVVADKVALASGSAMRVRVGPYADRATAEAARLRAEETTGAVGKVVASDASAAEIAASRATPAPAKPAPAAKPETAKPTEVAKATTPAPAPSAAKPSNSSAAGVGFAVQLSAPAVEADANALRDKARAQGLSAFVQPVETDSGRRYRVRLGPVADRAAAASLSEEAAAKLGNKGMIVPNP